MDEVLEATPDGLAGVDRRALEEYVQRRIEQIRSTPVDTDQLLSVDDVRALGEAAAERRRQRP